MDDGGAMDVDDMDIDLGTDENVAAIEAEAMQFESNNITTETSQTHGASFGSNLDLNVQANKVHIRGLDNLTTDDIKSYVSEHFPPEHTRIEWIDDTSANVHYYSAELAAQALASLTSEADLPISDLNTMDPVQLRRAKRSLKHPHVELHIRLAFISDVKKPRARDASRFYLMNPDQDPRERRQRYDNRRRGAERGGDRRYDQRSRDEEKEIPFDVNLYDDDPDSLAARINQPRLARRRSASPTRNASGDRSKRTAGYGRSSELLSQPNKDRNGRLGRERSASPMGDGDGRYGFDEDVIHRDSFRRRSTSPSRRLNGKSNVGKELLGLGSSSQSSLTASARPELFPGRSQSMSGSTSKELFPSKVPSMNGSPGKELFSTKMSTNHHRRKAAMDAADEHGADLFADRLTDPRLSSPSARPTSRKLEERISGNDSRVDRNVRSGLDIASRINGGPKESAGFNIRGTAPSEVSPGFSIRGVAGLSNPRVKELFPDKPDANGGKELFGGKIQGRGGPRRRAEDMFS